MMGKSSSDLFCDLFCCATVVGIWPRFIEPNLLTINKHKLPIPDLPEDLNHLKILQFSDLHLNPSVSDRFLNKLREKITKAQPDLIVFTGDFLCNAKLQEKERLYNFLCSLHAPLGCFAILGNHDYAESVSINPEGEYDTVDPSHSALMKGLHRLIKTPQLEGKITERARNVPLHSELLDLVKQTPFTLLENQTQVVPIGSSCLNITGLGEYMLGRCLPEKAFQGYDTRFPGLILSHNPDSIPLLEEMPGDLILCGHTHGGQVYLPYLWRKFTMIENMQYHRGLHHTSNKWVYINRGLGGILAFRWFSIPELTLFTLERLG